VIEPPAITPQAEIPATPPAAAWQAQQAPPAPQAPQAPPQHFEKPAAPPATAVVKVEPVAGVPAEPEKRTVPGWVVSVLVAVTLFLGCVSIWLYVSRDAPAEPQSNSGSPNTATPGTAPATAATGASAASAPAGQQHPLIRYVEITGLRISADLNKRTTVKYVLVNHSAADISDATLNVIVRSAFSRPQQPPVCVFPVKVAALGPYESKEFVVAIETPVRTLELPDWQNLRAEIQVIGQ
jgi:hypothetical protein